MPSLRFGTLKNTAIKMFIKTIAANIMVTIFQIRRERRFLIASCSFILDNCSATSLAVFSFSIFAPSNSLTDTYNISANRIRVSASGTDKFFSHLEMVCRTTWSLVANSSCEKPFCFLRVFKFSPNIVRYTPLL